MYLLKYGTGYKVIMEKTLGGGLVIEKIKSLLAQLNSV